MSIRKTRTVVETLIKNNVLTIKGLPVLTDPRFKEEYAQVGSFFCQAKPIDLTLKIGDTIKIANQLRTWKLDGIKTNKFGKLVAYFNKYNDKGNRIDTFYLVDGVKYLFPMTSGAARNGVAHVYREPRTELEKIFAENGWSRNRIQIVKEIKNEEASYGGRWCHHMTDNSAKYWLDYRTDGNIIETYEGHWVEKSSNQYHVGCMEEEKDYRINGGTYLVRMLARWNGKYCEVIMTKDADEKIVIKEIEDLLEKII